MQMYTVSLQKMAPPSNWEPPSHIWYGIMASTKVILCIVLAKCPISIYMPSIYTSMPFVCISTNSQEINCTTPFHRLTTLTQTSMLQYQQIYMSYPINRETYMMKNPFINCYVQKQVIAIPPHANTEM